jgi:hypothetical protein
LSNNVCSFSRKWGIKCLCNDDESAALLKLKSGLNLIVASAGLILNWLQEATIIWIQKISSLNEKYITPMRTTKWTNLWRSCLMTTEAFLNTYLMKKTTLTSVWTVTNHSHHHKTILQRSYHRGYARHCLLTQATQEVKSFFTHDHLLKYSLR